MSAMITEIRRELKENSDEKTRISGERFFRESVRIYGVKNAAVHKIARERYKSIKEKSKKEIFNLCEELWKSGYMEESLIACDWSYFIRKSFVPADFKTLEKWVENFVGNWASCDTLCNHTIGAFIEMYPEFLSNLKKLAKSKNRWMRRASAVTLIVPAKRGKFLDDILMIADILLLDKDDMVQKGYGWMLKSASHAHRREIFDYVMSKKNIMPRTALRYAIEKMPKELKKKAMER